MPRMGIRTIPAVAALLFLLHVIADDSRAQEAAAAPPPPVEAALETIESFYESLLDVMKRAEELGFEGRYAALEPPVLKHYDMRFMAAKVLGLQWKQLSDEQKTLWLETFSRLTVSTYAGRFNGYAGERLDVLSAEAGSRGTALVKTVIVPSDDDPVELDYRLLPVSGRWRIVDVYLDGTVSELALRRADYSAVLKRDGWDALIEAIQKKIAQAEAGELDD